MMPGSLADEVGAARAERAVRPSEKPGYEPLLMSSLER